MSDTDKMHQKFMAALFVLFILIGLGAWFEHGRTLECRQTAVGNGTGTVDAVKLCKR